jgi:hypothetical protein
MDILKSDYDSNLKMEISNMKSIQKIFTLLLLIILFSCGNSNSRAQSTNTEIVSKQIEPIVKLSLSGICHDKDSSSYSRTQNFTAFYSIAICIEAGGRLPKSQTKHIDEAIADAKKHGNTFVTLYDRSDWPHWSDNDKDCQNTRHEILISTSKKPVEFKTEKGCNVAKGEWFDPYSGNTYFKSAELDLDHIVPLKFAHGHGGDVWSRERKETFANDLDNLILVKASLNRQKGAKGLDDWLPPNQQYRCEYIARFNSIMVKYELSYIPSEQRIINRMVGACSN